MTTYFTGNPVGSTEVKDLYDNAENLDFLVVGPADSYPDRLGVSRKSWKGMENDFLALLAASGFETDVLTYTDGVPLTVDRPTQLIERASDPGNLYSVKLPSSFPVELSGTWAADELLLTQRTDESLRAELAASTGAGLSGYLPSETFPANTVGSALQGSALLSSILQQRGYPAELYLPDGYVTDGSVDYTTEIQLALDEQSALSMPPFPVKINKTGLTFHSGRQVFWPQGAQTVLSESDDGSYQIVRIHDEAGVTLHNPQLVGDKYNHIGTAGELGMGLSIRGSTDVTVYGGNISKCWGDGIYIGQTGLNLANRRIKLINTTCDDNRRQGISVISAIDLKIISPSLINTRSDNVGTTPLVAGPHAGIDIEPNDATAELRDIYISGLHTDNNQGPGLLVAIGLFVTTIPGAGRKHVSIKVDGHDSTGDYNGLSLVANKAPSGIVTGSFIFNDLSANLSQLGGFSAIGWPANFKAETVVNDMSLANWGQSPTLGGSQKYSSPISVYQDTGAENVGPIGGITFNRPSLMATQATSPGAGGGVYAKSDLAGVDVRNVNILDPQRWDIPTGFVGGIWIEGGGYIRDPLEVTKRQITGSTTLGKTLQGGLYYVNTAISPTVTLAADYFLGAPDKVFRSDIDGQFLDIKAPAGATFINGATTTDTRIRLQSAGSMVRLRWISATKLIALERFGNVTFNLT